MKYCNVQQAEAFFFEERSLLSAFVDSYLLSLSSNRNFTVITDLILIFAFSDLQLFVSSIGYPRNSIPCDIEIATL